MVCFFIKTSFAWEIVEGFIHCQVFMSTHVCTKNLFVKRSVTSLLKRGTLSKFVFLRPYVPKWYLRSNGNWKSILISFIIRKNTKLVHKLSRRSWIVVQWCLRSGLAGRPGHSAPSEFEFASVHALPFEGSSASGITRLFGLEK